MMLRLKFKKFVIDLSIPLPDPEEIEPRPNVNLGSVRMSYRDL